MALSLSVVTSMGDIAQAEWDRLAAPYGTPFLTWAFLALLEQSGSICPETGWSPNHFLLRKDGKPVAAAPFYAKTHSGGEFVFDYQFALLAERLSIPYYPKLIGMIPATPAPLWRVLVAEGEDESALTALVLKAAAEAADGAGLSGLHLPWPAADLDPGQGFSRWDHQSFLWTDEGYGDFEGYLSSFSKNMRRNIRREGESVREAGIRTAVVGAEEARGQPELLERMADYYEATNDKFGPYGARFLTRDFFRLLPEYLKEGWLLSAGFDGEEPVGLAFLFEGKDTLYGRYWGAARELPGLHFELCYYQPIAYALEKGLSRFDPGMGSEHKARRGFRSVLAPSYHLAFDQRLNGVFAHYLPLLSEEEQAHAEELNGDLPFKKGP